jgi:hypothetical protein
MARTKKNVDPFEFHGSDDESDDDDKLGARRRRGRHWAAAGSLVRGGDSESSWN